MLIRWVAVDYGKTQMKSMTETMLAHAENTISGASRSLEILANEGVGTCSAANIRRLGEVVFTRADVKEIGIIDGKGRMLCSNFGVTLVDMSEAGATSPQNGEAGLTMVPTRVSGQSALGVLRNTDTGRLVALVDPDAVMLNLLHGGALENCHARIVLNQTTMVSLSGATEAEILEFGPGPIERKSSSRQFPIYAAMQAPQSALLEPFLPALVYTKIGAGLLGVTMLIIMGAMLRNRDSVESELDAAMYKSEFLAHYQPIIDVATGRVCGCEALIRWQKPNGEMVGPDLFVPVAEANGQIIPMTRQLMAQINDDLSELFENGPDFYVAINLVAEHFGSGDIVDEVRRQFSDGNIKASNLVFEITERRPLNDIQTAQNVVAELQALGSRVALDDAGTGHGGLAYIQSLGMDIIKIDRMFVEAIGTDGVSAPIVDALLELGSKLKMSIVAEGVETEEQFAYLCARGARYFQGYLFSPPMPPQALCRFVESFNGSPHRAEPEIFDEPVPELQAARA